MLSFFVFNRIIFDVKNMNATFSLKKNLVKTYVNELSSYTFLQVILYFITFVAVMPLRNQDKNRDRYQDRDKDRDRIDQDCAR